MTSELESQAYGVLATLALLLLLLVTGGVVYLTVIEWRDKRKRSQEALDSRTPVRDKKYKGSARKRKGKK